MTDQAWVAPETCDQCPHPISQHTLWEPDPDERGWMLCLVRGCDKCWHEWPSTVDQHGSPS